MVDMEMYEIDSSSIHMKKFGIGGVSTESDV